MDQPALVMGHSFGGGVAIVVAHDYPARVRALVLVNSIGGSAWTRRGSTIRSMAERPLWDWGIHFPADLLPVRQARLCCRSSSPRPSPTIARPRPFFGRGLVRRADLTAELDELRRRGLPVVVLWGQRDQLITRASFEDMCKTLGQPQRATVPGTHAWLLADPDAFGEVMTNVVDVLGMAGGDDTLDEAVCRPPGSAPAPELKRSEPG